MDAKTLPITSVRYWKEKVIAIWLLIIMFFQTLLPSYSPNTTNSNRRNNLNRRSGGGGKPQNLMGFCGSGG